MDYKITLKAARINANMTQAEVAEKLGKTKQSIAAWENGKRIPRTDVLLTLCELYRVPIDNIFLARKLT